jgi:hypothetical protein
MPNWCSNTITITGDKKIISGMTRLIESIKKTEGEEPGVFRTLIGREPGMTQDRYNNSGWYDSNVSYWGTKWDVSYDDCCFTFDEESISLHPETAWSPPIEFCKSMVKEYKSIKIHIFYSEGGNDFCGQCDIYLDEEGIVCCDEEDYGYSEGLYRLDIDGFWGEVESMVDSYCCEEDNSAEEFVEDHYSYVSEEHKKEIIEMFNELKETYGEEVESNN